MSVGPPDPGLDLGPGLELDGPCLGCGAPPKPGAGFCVGCGRGRADRPAVAVAPSLAHHWRDLRVALVVFGALLAVQVVSGIAFHLSKDVFAVTVLGSLGFAVVTAAAALGRRDLVRQPIVRAGFSIRGYAAIVLASPVLVVLVAGYVRALAGVLGLHLPGELDELKAHGLVTVILLVAVAPPLTEELAFRGVVLGALRRQLRPAEAIAISAFAFAILHLSIPSLVTHLPLGLYFGWLAVRSGSLWPGVVAHACHNLGVVLGERVEWLGWLG